MMVSWTMLLQLLLSTVIPMHLVLGGATGNIEHVIVLMLENRAFDHMLGYTKQDNAEVDGCLPDNPACTNPADPFDAASPVYTVDDSAVYVQTDPKHSISGTTAQVYGATDADNGGSPDMQGFIASYTGATGTAELGAGIMKQFSPDHIPAITTLAAEFAVFDGYFASVPGPTEVNRAYVGSATSNGMGTNDEEKMIKGFPQKTMFKQLEEMGLEYRVYFEFAPLVLEFKDMRRPPARKTYRFMPTLFDDLASGDLPAYSWVEPRWMDTPAGPANDQHPDHDASAGDQLIKDIYEAVRASPAWNKTAFVITYDEHGGFFDHVPPPTGVPNPDGLNSTDDPFDFTRLGVRVPFIVVSPWVAKGTVVHAPASGEGQFEHSSVVSTVVHKLFKAEEGFTAPSFLTARDEWAATFENIFEQTDESSYPRTDCPMTLPDIPSHRLLFPATLPPLDGKKQVSHLQRELIAVAAGASEDSSFDYQETESWTELEAAKYVVGRMNIFFKDEGLVTNKY